jgi:hypothetical protein
MASTTRAVRGWLDHGAEGLCVIHPAFALACRPTYSKQHDVQQVGGVETMYFKLGGHQTPCSWRHATLGIWKLRRSQMVQQ